MAFRMGEVLSPASKLMGLVFSQEAHRGPDEVDAMYLRTDVGARRVTG